MSASATTSDKAAQQKSQSLASPIAEWFIDDEIHARNEDTQYCLAWNTAGSMTDRLCIFRIEGGNATSVADILYSDIESCRFNKTYDTKIRYPMAIFRYRPDSKARYVGVKLLLDLSDMDDQSKYRDLLAHARKHCEGVECQAARMQDIWQFGKNTSNGAPARSSRPRDEQEEAQYPQFSKRRRVTPIAPRIMQSDELPRHSRSPSPVMPFPDAISASSQLGTSVEQNTNVQQSACAPKSVIDLTDENDSPAVAAKVEAVEVKDLSQSKCSGSTVQGGEALMSDLTIPATVHSWLEKVDLTRYRGSLEAIGLIEWKDLCRFANLSQETQKAFVSEYIKDMTALHILFFTEALKELRT